jgi:hypothetical protein
VRVYLRLRSAPGWLRRHGPPAGLHKHPSQTSRPCEFACDFMPVHSPAPPPSQEATLVWPHVSPCLPLYREAPLVRPHVLPHLSPSREAPLVGQHGSPARGANRIGFVASTPPTPKTAAKSSPLRNSSRWLIDSVRMTIELPPPPHTHTHNHTHRQRCTGGSVQGKARGANTPQQ